MKLENTDSARKQSIEALESKSEKLSVAVSTFASGPGVDEALKAVTLSVSDRGRLDEITEFYRQLNSIVENVIEKFTGMEKIVNKLEYSQLRGAQQRTSSQTNLGTAYDSDYMSAQS